MPGWWRVRASGEERPREAGAAVRRALVAALDGELERTEALLAAVVRADSSELDAYLALARLFRRRGEIGRAIHVHQNLLLRRDSDAAVRFQALVGLADDFRAGGFLRRAIAAYEEVLAEHPDHPAALRALTGLLIDAREPRRAIALARRLARAEGRDGAAAEAPLWVDLAQLERGKGRADLARRALRRALRRDPRCVRAWIALGEVESELGRARKALAAWRRVPELDRRAGPRVYGRLAAAFAAVGRPLEYERWLRGLLEAQPEDLAARLALAAALAARDAGDEAEAELRSVLEREPEALGAHVALGRLLLAEGRAGEAAKAHEQLLGVLERRADLWTAADDEGEAFP